MHRWRNMETVVCIKLAKHWAVGSVAGSDRESLSLGSWIKITAMQKQTGSSVFRSATE